MYGYILPVKEQLNCADFALYRAFYCGVCKATGRLYGSLPRFTTNYDIVFLSVLLHALQQSELEFEAKGCVCNPFKKKVTVCNSPLLDKIVQTNILLSYYKLVDAVKDKEGTGKRLFRRVLLPHYKKASTQIPQIDLAMRQGFERLDALEKENCANIDRVADCFSSILQDVVELLLQERADENIKKLCYNVGKFVYLADALDDVDEDFKKKRYNPFLASFEGYTTRQEYYNKYRQEFEFILSVTVNRAIECFNAMKLPDATLLTNIVHKGLRSKCEQILLSEKKLPKAKV